MKSKLAKYNNGKGPRRVIQTPWGPIEVPNIVPQNFQCGKCGKCCIGFVLSARELDRENWYGFFLNNLPYEYPKDIGAIYNLMEKIPGAFSVSGKPIYSCKAFDREKKTCTIFDDAPKLRPIACWAFPYNYDLQSLSRFPYIGCVIFQKTTRWLLEGFLKGLVGAYDPLKGITFSSI